MIGEDKKKVNKKLGTFVVCSINSISFYLCLCLPMGKQQIAVKGGVYTYAYTHIIVMLLN